MHLLSGEIPHPSRAEPESENDPLESILEIVLGIFAYTAIAALIVRFFQGLRDRDDDMRAITEQWIREEKKAPLPN